MYVSLGLKYQLFLPYFNETWIFSTVFRKIPNPKFHENPSIESRGVPCERTDRHIDMTMLVAFFFNYLKAPKENTFYFLMGPV